MGGAETLRKWMRRSKNNTGVRPGVSTADQAEIRRLKREVTELRRANKIFRTAPTIFRSGTRPICIEMIRYVVAYRDQFGVEPSCRVLANTVGGFMTSRAIREQVLGNEMEGLHAENYVFNVCEKCVNSCAYKAGSSAETR